jgi:hypothetical protein
MELVFWVFEMEKRNLHMYILRNLFYEIPLKSLKLSTGCVQHSAGGKISGTVTG